MTTEKAKQLIERELQDCAALFKETGVKTDYSVEETKNDTKDGAETIDLLGVISLKAEGTEEGEEIFIPLNTELDSSGYVIDDVLRENISSFRQTVSDCCERIRASEDIKATIKELAKEIDEELEQEHKERLARLDAETKKNLKIAICATVALFAVAAICFFIKGLLG